MASVLPPFLIRHVTLVICFCLFMHQQAAITPGNLVKDTKAESGGYLPLSVLLGKDCPPSQMWGTCYGSPGTASSSSMSFWVLSCRQMAGQPLTEPEHMWLTVTASCMTWHCSQRNLVCCSFAVWLPWPAGALGTPRKLPSALVQSPLLMFLYRLPPHSACCSGRTHFYVCGL